MDHRFRTPFAPFVLLVALILVSAAPTSFCLWDRDTLKAEAEGAPGVAEAIVGHFDRYPDLYYEMRFERVARDVEATPNDLALYDDAAVALDRLGRSDEAIEWMARKRRTITYRAEGADPHHEYTYLANLGTFYVHRWLHTGAKRDSLTDLERGRDLLKQALELNPDAHFGRERWQLMAVEFLIDSPAEKDGWPATLLPIQGSRHLGGKSLEKAGYADAVEGLTGLITLGSAWESLDILDALEWALVDRGDGHLAKLASLRTKELRAAGRSSLIQRESGGETPIYEYEYTLYPADIANIEKFYPKARAAADARREKRNAFLQERLTRGEHPDSDPNFWKDWKGNPAPKMKIASGGFDAWSRRNPEIVLGILFALMVCTVIGITALFIRRRRVKRAPA